MSIARDAATKHRLLSTAAELFAEHGFHGTKMRDIAQRATVNLAASNYHYGSKRTLYLAVLRAQFAEVRTELARHRATWPAGGLARLSRAGLVDLLQNRTTVMLHMLLGPPPGVHGTLMQREMCDPSEALPVIVDEFIRPMLGEVQEIIAHLAPQLDRDDVERCAFSLMGQVLFYRTALPAMSLLKGLRHHSRALSTQLGKHIAAFSVGGIESLSPPTRKRTGPRPVSRSVGVKGRGRRATASRLP